jgi:hypothetical protein
MKAEEYKKILIEIYDSVDERMFASELYFKGIGRK